MALVTCVSEESKEPDVETGSNSTLEPETDVVKMSADTGRRQVDYFGRLRERRRILAVVSAEEDSLQVTVLT